jgi:hypothetical protein
VVFLKRLLKGGYEIPFSYARFKYPIKIIGYFTSPLAGERGFLLIPFSDGADLG